jgi:uncharacterized coiled-coil DUF342 family protein
MKIKELIEKLQKYNENLEIKIDGRDEYNCEIEGLKLKSIREGYSGLYLNVSSYYDE